MRQKLYSLVLLHALIVVLIAQSCTLASASPIKLRVAMWINDVPEIAETEKILREYEAAHPSIELELIQQPFTGYHDKLIAMVAAGDAPDVMVVSRIYLPSFASNGFVLPVDRWLARERFDLRKDVAELASGTYEGKVYGIPIWGGPLITLINVEMFDEAGQPRPAALFKSNAWTWENAIKIGQKITRDKNGDGTIDQWMFPWQSLTSSHWGQKVLAYGGRVLNEAKTECLLQTPEAIAGLRLHADLALRYNVAPRTGAYPKFEQGGVAVNTQWAAEAPNIHKRVNGMFTMDLAPMLSGPAGMVHIAGGVPVTVSASSKHPEEAYKFATWFAMYSDEWQLRGIPANMSTIRHEYRDYLANYFASPDVVAIAMSGWTEVEPNVHLKNAELQKTWDPIITKLRAGSISPEEAASELTRQTNIILGAQ